LRVTQSDPADTAIEDCVMRIDWTAAARILPLTALLVACVRREPTKSSESSFRRRVPEQWDSSRPESRTYGGCGSGQNRRIEIAERPSKEPLSGNRREK